MNISFIRNLESQINLHWRSETSPNGDRYEKWYLEYHGFCSRTWFVDPTNEEITAAAIDLIKAKMTHCERSLKALETVAENKPVITAEVAENKP